MYIFKRYLRGLVLFYFIFRYFLYEYIMCDEIIYWNFVICVIIDYDIVRRWIYDSRGLWDRRELVNIDRR